jgi:hypothetical protein
MTLQHAAAALFTDREASWNQIAFLVRTGTAKEWIEVDRNCLSRSQLAGFRNRLDRLVPMVRRSQIAERVWKRLGEDVAARYAKAYPQAAPITTVRIVNTNWPTNLPEMTHPLGHWEIPPIEQVDPARVRILATIELQGGRAVSVTGNTASVPAGLARTIRGVPTVPRSAPPRQLRPFADSTPAHEADAD